MIIGYARVSTEGQNLQRQVHALEKRNVDRIYTEKKSGADNDRQVLNMVISELSAGDTLVVQSMERLSRDQSYLSKLFLLVLLKDAEIEILNMPNFDGIANKNVQTLLRAVIIEVQKFMAAEELRSIGERQRQGIVLAKAKGVYKGRPKKYSLESNNDADLKKYHEIVELLQVRCSITEIMKATGISNTVIYRIKKELEL